MVVRKLKFGSEAEDWMTRCSETQSVPWIRTGHD